MTLFNQKFAICGALINDWIIPSYLRFFISWSVYRYSSSQVLVLRLSLLLPFFFSCVARVGLWVYSILLRDEFLPFLASTCSIFIVQDWMRNDFSCISLLLFITSLKWICMGFPAQSGQLLVVLCFSDLSSSSVKPTSYSPRVIRSPLANNGAILKGWDD